MSTETASKLNRQSSQLPLDWATKIQESVPQHVSAQSSQPIIAFVGVPDLKKTIKSPSEASLETKDQPETPEVVFAQSPPVAGPSPGVVRAPKSQAMFEKKARERESVSEPTSSTADESAKNAIADNMMAMLARQIQSPNSISPKPVADIPDPDWNDQQSSQSTDRPVVVKDDQLNIATELDIDEKAIKSLADQILKRYPAGTTCLIGFVGCESNPHIEETCALVAKEIASREIGQVLLIDADFDRKQLSKACIKSTATGLQNLLMRSTLDIESALIRSEQMSLDFMPAGNVNIKYWLRASERANEFVERIKPAYRVVCLTLGDAHSRSTQMLSSICDGVYLLVSMTESSQVVAQSATRQLHTVKANIMGCVVSECPADDN